MTKPGVRFYRSSQPWGKGVFLTYPNHVSYRSPIIKLTVRPFSIPYLFKTQLLSHFFFPFRGYLETNLFPPTCFTLACGLCVLLLFVFVFRSALQTCV